MKHTLRSTFAALLAALALACAGLGDRVARSDAPSPTDARSFQNATRTGGVTAREALALAFLQGGSPVVGAPGMRTGALPRVAPGADGSGPLCRGIAHAARMAAEDARIRCTQLPTFARRLAAARDGTLSARTNGVPPPALA